MLDQIDERIEAGVGHRRLLDDRRAVEREAEGVERVLDAANLLLHVVHEVLEPSARHGCGGGFALLRLPIVAGLLA